MKGRAPNRKDQTLPVLVLQDQVLVLTITVMMPGLDYLP